MNAIPITAIPAIGANMVLLAIRLIPSSSKLRQKSWLAYLINFFMIKSYRVKNDSGFRDIALTIK